jgi:hypothetical protein
MKKLCVYITAMLVLAGGETAFSQSTTPWILIGAPGENSIQRNSSYVSVTYLHSRINPKANWWTRLIATQKTAVVIAETSADYGTGNGTYADKRSSPPRELKHFDKPIDIAWKQPLAVNLPATFRSLRTTVTIGTVAKDGAAELLKTANELSSKIPNPTPAQNIIGVVSSVKTLIDFLVGNQLTKNQVACDSELLTVASTSFPSGNYVVFAGDTADQYAKYTTEKKKLAWDGSVLSFDGTPIEDVSYFVINVDYVPQIFKEKTKDVLSNNHSAWAALYTTGFELIDKIDTKNVEDVKKEMQATFQSAHKVLNLDSDYIMTEKDEIHRSLVQIASANIKKRLDSLKDGNAFFTRADRHAKEMINSIK